MVNPPSDAALPPGSLVLITAVNGYMGCKVADQLLHHGYRRNTLNFHYYYYYYLTRQDWN